MNTSKIEKWKSAFQSLLFKIGQDLTSDNVKSMEFLLSKEIPQGVLEKTENATDILTLMQKRYILSYENTERLSSLLKEIGRDDQAVQLREFKKDLHQSKSVPYNIREERLVTHFKTTDDFARLKNLMEENRVVTISGLLGAGKSQMTIAFCIDLQKNNKDCVVWHCNASSKTSLLTSLRVLADELAIPTSSEIWSDTDEKGVMSLIGEKLQNKLHKKDVTASYHLIVLDDVNSESKEYVRMLVRRMLTPEDLNIKFLITTRNKTLLKEYKKLDLQGFTPDESLKFLINGKEIEKIDEDRKSQYRKLAEEMGNLPLGLYMARTYMENMSIDPSRFMKLLKTQNIEDIEDQLTEMDLQATEINLFTAIKCFIYQDLKKKIKETRVFEVFEMFQMTQFLENEEIPICLLEFVYREDGYNDTSKTMKNANSLIQELQKCSFGTIEGDDDNRRLSVHSTINLTLSICTPEDEKRFLLKKLLWGFALLLDKDVLLKTDLLRMKLLIPHARAFLRHAEKANLIADYDNLVLMAFVYNVVGFGYNYGHYKTIPNEYSERSKACCFLMMDCVEAEIDTSLKESFAVLYDENSVEFYEALAKRKCEILWTKLDEMATMKKEILREIVPRFIQQRFRTQLNMEDLSRRLNPESTDFVINDETYRALVNKELALPLDCMESYFLHEIVLAVFYTYGRQFSYQRQMTDFKEARRLLSYLLIANEIGQKLNEKQKQLSPINALLSEVRGVLQSRVQDDAQLYQNKMEVLSETAERAIACSRLEAKYHVYGILKMDDTSVNSQIICLKLAIKCFTRMLQLDIDDNKKREVYTNGCELADEILQRAKNLGDRQNITGYIVSLAEFYLSISIENIPSDLLGRAEQMFLDVFPKDVFEENYKRPIERHELRAVNGLIKYYELTGRQEDADNLKSKLNDIDM